MRQRNRSKVGQLNYDNMKPTLTITGSGWSRKDAAKFARCNRHNPGWIFYL